MINIFRDTTMNGCMNAVIDKIKENGINNGHHIVIIPDSHTLTAERVICERLGIKGSMNIEAVSFSRLAKKVLGDSAKHHLSKEGAVLYFKKTINRQLIEKKGKKKGGSTLSHYGESAKTDGFAGEMYAVIASLRNNNITPQKLKEIKEIVAKLNEESTTKAKLEDIIVLYEEYLKTLKDVTDSTSRLEKFIEICGTSSKIKDSYIYIYGFDALSQMQRKIIHSLTSCAKEVNIGLVSAGDIPNKTLYPDFGGEWKNSEIKECEHLAIKPPFSVLHDNVFNYDGKAKIEDSDNVVVFTEVNAYEQYNAVAREIVRLVRREELRYKDIVVVDCLEPASTDFKEILNRYHIPHFMDERYTLAKSLIFRYLHSLFEAVRFGMRMDKVRILIKNPLFCGDYEKISNFENYILEKNYSYKDFDEEFEEYEEYRLKLKEIQSSIQSLRNVNDCVRYVRELIENEEFKQKFDSAIGIDEELADFNKQAKERLKEILNEYEKLIGEDTTTPESFIKTLASSCEAEEIALIPRYLDSVYVSTLRESCIISPKVVFVVNATSNHLPNDQGYQAILSADDINNLESIEGGGIRLYPTPIDRIREEKFAFIDLITKTQKLYIGYPKVAIDGTANKPSQAIKDICEILSEKPAISLNDSFSYLDASSLEEGIKIAEDAVGHPDNAFYTLLNGLGSGESDSEKKKEVWKEVNNSIYATLTNEEKRSINKKDEEKEEFSLDYTFNTDRHTSVSQIEKYFNCPFSHFLQYGLKINEREEGALRVKDVGTYVHNVLEIYFNNFIVMPNREGKYNIHTVSLEEMEKLADKAVTKVFGGDKVVPLLNDPETKFLIERLKNESKKTAISLSENLRKGSFEPFACEWRFGNKNGARRENDVVEIKTKDASIFFTGSIDRIDVAKIKDESGEEKEVAVAIDYKTGSIEAKTHEVYYGIKLQLYLYLKAIKEKFGFEPAGAFYLPIKSGYTSEGNNYKFKGQVVFDEKIVEALDKEGYQKALNGEGPVESNTVPIKFTIKNGELQTRAKKDLLTTENMEKMLTYLDAVIPSAIEEISSGYIEKFPVADKCKYCYHKDACGGVEESEHRVISKKNSPIYVDEEDIKRHIYAGTPTSVGEELECNVKVEEVPEGSKELAPNREVKGE